MQSLDAPTYLPPTDYQGQRGFDLLPTDQLTDVLARYKALTAHTRAEHLMVYAAACVTEIRIELERRRSAGLVAS